MYPAHGEQLRAHITHLREEIAEEADDLAVDPVNDIVEYRTGDKIPYEHLVMSPRFRKSKRPRCWSGASQFSDSV